jgi:hypothetical protein
MAHALLTSSSSLRSPKIGVFSTFGIAGGVLVGTSILNFGLDLELIPVLGELPCIALPSKLDILTGGVLKPGTFFGTFTGFLLIGVVFCCVGRPCSASLLS